MDPAATRASLPWWMRSQALRSMFARPPQPGDVMEFDYGDDNPFRTPRRVVVRAVESGWVNYRFEDPQSPWQDESMRIKQFNFCYVKA